MDLYCFYLLKVVVLGCLGFIGHYCRWNLCCINLSFYKITFSQLLKEPVGLVLKLTGIGCLIERLDKIVRLHLCYLSWIQIYVV